MTLVDECPTDLWARYALGRVLERQSKFADALPHMRLAAVMSGDVEHEAGGAAGGAADGGAVRLAGRPGLRPRATAASGSRRRRR